MKKYIYALLILLILSYAVSAGAANRYVRAGATGSNNGADWTNAFTSLPSTLIRSDTYYIADGTYGFYKFDDAENGTQVITIKKATATDHGTNTGWNSSYGDGIAQFGGFEFNRGYYVIDGQQRTSWTSGYGLKIQGTMANQKLVNFLGKPAASHVTIKYVELEHRGRYKATSDDIFYAQYSGASSRPEHITIQYCYIHNCSRCHFLWRNVGYWTIEYCFISENDSTAAVHGQAISDGDSDYIVLRYNIWRNIDGTGAWTTMYGDAYNWDIYGNIVYYTDDFDGGSYATLRVLYDASNWGRAYNWKIYNNTFVNTKGSHVGFTIDAGSGNVAYNNMFYNCPPALFWGITPKYSAYFNTTVYQGDDASTRQTGEGDPFVNSANYDFHLSSATQKGKSDLGSPYNITMDGILRDQDDCWDRGAYEYNPDYTIAPPHNLRLSAY